MIRRIAFGLRFASSAFVISPLVTPAYCATLPVPCAAGACAGTSTFVGAGRATAVQAGSKLTVTQSTANATLNWQSFNISADGKVQFVQPSASSVALNRIFQADPSKIFGVLQANGSVYLINRNGIIFGANAQVNVGGLVASTLDLKAVDANGALTGLTTPGLTGQAALQQFQDANGLQLTSAPVTISNGATLQTTEGGQVLVFAPSITNQGTIRTPGGQTLLAAGNQIYLASTTDPNLRGLLVEVGGVGGTVTNGVASNASAASVSQLVGQITAERGNVTLAAHAVNQLGLVSATTSINENGSIRLQARDGGSLGSPSSTPGTGGILTLGAHSVTEVTLDTADTATTVDSVAQPKSDIALFGKTIDVLNNAQVRATGGTIEATAEANQASPLLTGLASDGSRFYLAGDAVLDVSGANVTLPVDSNIIAVQLRGTEFADDPLQRNGPLRGQTVYVDVRAHGTNADGTPWQGTPLANVTGEIAAVTRNVSERNLDGGKIAIQSQGDAILAPGSELNVAGGSIRYTAGLIKTSNLLTTTGQIVSISAADPNMSYAGILDSTTAVNAKWGVTGGTPAVLSTYAPGYVEGKDAGTVSLAAPRFVFDGGVNGGVDAGVYQRLPTNSVQLPTASAGLYRSYDEVPLGATLIIGQPGGADFVTGNLVFQSGNVLPGLHNADGSAFDPLQTTALPASYVASALRPELFGPGGFNAASLSANGQITEPAGTSLNFSSGGSFSAAASVIDLEGSIDAPGGAITAIAKATANTAASGVSFTVGPQASLTARGEWVNDYLAALMGSANDVPLYVGGGTVSLTAVNGNMLLSPGSLIDVSGGAQLTSQGQVNSGNGGSIQISVAAPSQAYNFSGPPLELTLGSTLRGYGVSQGGKLSLTARGVCIAAANCSGGDASVLWLTPARFASGGFASYSVTAQQGGLSVEPGTQLSLQQDNLRLPWNLTTIASSPTLFGFAVPTLLNDLVRKPVNLSLNVALPATGTNGNSDILTVTPATPSLEIGAGASIIGDPGAALSLTSNSRVIVDGSLRAPGGSISLTLSANANLLQTDYAPTQAIWLGTGSVLDVAGIAEAVVGDTGLRTGNVLDGGTVSLTASRGSIELLPGSLIDVSGTTSMLDIAPVGGGPSRTQLVASAGGTVHLTAADSMVVGGTMRASAGQAAPGNPQPEGGSLFITLDPTPTTAGDANAGQVTSTFPAEARQIQVSSSLAPTVVGSGVAVSSALDGLAFVGADSISDAGFDSVSLRAVPILTANGILPGSINFSGNVSLTAGRQVTLDAAVFSVNQGSTARIQAPYVSFGNSNQRSDVVVPSPSSGTGALDVSAGFLELYGFSTLQGIGAAAFSSSGDLRLRGLTHNDSLDNPTSLISGGLSAAGSLDLTATQIYATTLSQFTIASDQSTGSITVHSAPGPRQDILSAGSSMTLSANSIVQEGTLRAPLGEITLQGNSVKLGAGSLTSTSADGLTIPFGTTQGGFDWVYTIQAGLNTVYGTNGIAPPAQHVNLQGAKVDVQKGAVIDVAGGGDLQAYEWIPGVGGTQDVLSQATRPNQFAIVPSLNVSVAPYDLSASLGTQLNIGDAVYLSASPGLPAGTYVLMPARYALLPGAFLVTPVSGYRGIQAGQTFAAPGGGNIVSGYRTVTGTSFGDSLTSGFEVVPTSVVQQQAQYTTSSANQFFAQQAAAASAPVPRLPVDSGLLSLTPSESLSLNGTLLTTPGKGGIGAGVDISSDQILVTTDAATVADPGQIVLTADSLDHLGAQSLLLGGQRNGQDISTQAQSVVIDGGVNLTAPELMLAASGQVSVNDGASITAQGTAATSATYTLQGDGAFLRVSSGPQATVTRTGAAGASGVLTLAPGSSITASQGSVYLDASSNVLAQSSFALSGGDLAVQSSHISVGNVPSAIPGTVLGANVFDVAGLRNLLLASNSSVDFYGSVNLSAQNLTLDAAGLSGFGAAGDVAKLSVGKTLLLENSQGATQSVPGSGAGTLQLSAADVAIGPGAFSSTGFNAVSLAAQNAVTGAADGTLSTSGDLNGTLSTSGDLNITASRITTGAGRSLVLDARGAVTLAAPVRGATLAAVTDLGGSLSVSGSKINLNTRLDLPSGKVSLTTTGTAAGDDLVLGSAATVNVAGITRVYDGVTVASPGGSVALASQGKVSLAAGSAIDVSGATGGSGGSLSIAALGAAGTVALNGTLTGGGSGSQGSSFSIDAQNFGDFSVLNQALNAGGFLGERSVRLRGAGDLVVAAGAVNTVTAHQVSLEADQGSVIVQGAIDASGANGGSVQLAASNNIDILGSIDAHATAAQGSGGKVELDIGTPGGRLSLESTSDINVGGAKGGSVLLRVPRDTVSLLASGGSGVALNGRILGAGKTTLEAYSVYQNLTGSISPTDVLADSSNPIYQDAFTFMQSAGTIASALGRGSDASFVVAPGIEIQSAGDLALNTPWNLYAWTFNGTNGAQGVPGILTLRAGGALTINSQLSDGFVSPTAFTLPAAASNSWSYRLVAGSDLAAANPLAIDSASAADFTITAGTTGTGGGRGGPVASPHMVRTGDGFIDVATSGNFVLENQLSLLYTAGVASITGIPVVSATNGRVPVPLAYPTDGGDISIFANQNIVGAPSNQFVNAWLWRTAGLPSAAASSSVAWTVNFQNFQQGIGALGGGNVSVRAGGDIDDLSVSIPSIGRQVGGKTIGDSVVQVTGGGNLAVNAGGSILGGSYYAGLGTIDLRAGADIGSDSSVAGGTGLSPLIGLGDASLSATARGNLQLSGIVNPTLLNPGALQGDQNYFSTYGAGARAELTAVGGNITLADESGALSTQLSSSFADGTLGPSFPDQGGAPVAIDILPPTLNAYALNGDINLGRVLALSPAANGSLQMFADGNFIAAPLQGGVAQLFQSDADPALLPSIEVPQPGLQSFTDIVSGLSVTLADQHAAAPIHSNDTAPQPVRIVARTGDIIFPAVNGGAQSGIWSAVAAQIVAARDIVNLDLVAQNLSPADVTSVTAGRDIIYPLQRSAAGLVLPNASEITVDGPGELQLEAARDVNLGTSAGITTRGNLTNLALPAAGAAVSVEAGVGSGGPQLAAFIAKYIQGSSVFDADLIAFMADTSGGAGLTAAQAKQIFAKLSQDVQRSFVEQEFFSLLRSSGRQAARLGNGDFTAAFAAIETLFPGANPTLAAGQTNPYVGNIELYFSRIYTEQGGSISLLAPGGEINVGLAAPPASFGISKTPDQLGLVAQSVGDINAFAYKDFQVNQSRVFAADGGNILVWSTEGDIDAGRGSKTAISAPPPTITIDPNGRPILAYRPALTGSGIQTLVSTPGVSPGDVDLFAPHGVVNANDAGIVAGNLTIAATAVLGTSNISVSGTTVGVPVAVTGLGANVASAAGSSGSATGAAESAASNREQRSSTPVADTALGWLDVFVTGLGEDQCKPDDVECLKRQKSN